MWLSRDPIKNPEIAQGPNLYEYVRNDPTNAFDPLGLWQFTISGGGILGGSFTFGNNGGSNWFNGQWNVGAYVGVGEGLSANLDPNDTGCHKVGSDKSLRGEGVFGLGENVEGQADIRSLSDTDENSADVSLNLPGIKNASIPILQVEDGRIQFKKKKPSIGAGESAYVGWGVTNYYGGSPCDCKNK
jgi:hypothetical protein